MAFLTTRDTDLPGGRFNLTGRETLIGRHPECDLVVEVGAVSRHHARIRCQEDDSYWLEDLGSRNGTFLNGQLVTEPQRLHAGDRFRICEVEFELHLDTGGSSGFIPDDSQVAFGGSRFGVVMVDDDDSVSGNSSLAQVEIRQSTAGVQLASTAETKLAALLQITLNLGRALALDEVLPKVLDSLFAIFPHADRGFIVLEGAGGTLVPRWIKTRRPDPSGETVRVSRTIIRKAMQEGHAILSLDASNDARFQASESIADFRIRSMICAPLIDGEGNAFGALQIDTGDQRNRFVEADVEVLAAVASQAGIAISNAQLHEQALQQREVEQDLKLAIEVQSAFLPSGPPQLSGYRFHSHYRAAHHIGGDYFDYVQLPDGRVAVVVADVVGHGVAAAMYMAKLSAETRFALASEADPGRAVGLLNDRMNQLQLERFVTFLLLVVDPQRHTLTIVNAGHMPPMLRDPQGNIQELGERQAGYPIAILPQTSYESIEVPIAPGELAVLYTDGLNEAMNAGNEQFGIERIRQTMAEGGGGEAVVQRLTEAVGRHVGSEPQYDDMCMVVIERTEPESPLSGPSTPTEGL
jgi:phosphoserine phosphatase RsbU/P